MKHFWLRLISLIGGLCVFSFGIVLTIKANIGYAPWDVFHIGLATTVGLSLGTVSILVGIIIGVIIVILGEKIGLGTIFNMVLVGAVIDIIFPHVPLAENLPGGVIMMLVGIFTMAIGTYFYVKSAFGAGPRDSLMVALNRKTRLPVGLCRFILELSVLIIGLFLGGMVGIGTVIFVVAIGFAVQIVFKLFRFDAKAVRHETLRDTYAAIRNANGIS